MPSSDSSAPAILAIFIGLLATPPTLAQPVAASAVTLSNVDVFGSVASNDNLGRVMAVGDFDANGWDDLVIGSYLRRVAEEFPGGGQVAVYYGDEDGLQIADGPQLWSQDSPGIDDETESNDEFGRALAVGDFDMDGYDDLAISAPREDLELCLPVCVITEDYGVVHVLYGSAGGLSSSRSQLLRQTGGGLPGDLEEDDRLGWSLAAGDFDIDGYFDLAIGVPFESLETGTTVECGAINVIYGSATGLDTGRTLFWHQNITGIDDVATSGDNWGQVLATANFRGLTDPSRPIDLVVGSPDDDLGSATPGGFIRKGSVQILQGSVLGLLNVDNIFLELANPDIPGTAEQDAAFGAALAIGDFDGDGFDDLATSATEKDGGGVVDSGLVYVIESGGASGLDLSTIQVWSQSTAGIADSAETGDDFGGRLAAADLNADGFDDLVIAAPGEEFGELQVLSGNGAVHLLQGSPAGIVADDDQFYDQEQVGETFDTNEQFGFGLAAGLFDKAGPSLVIAAPFERVVDGGTTAFNAGKIHILSQTLFADGFESGNTSAWSNGS